MGSKSSKLYNHVEFCLMIHQHWHNKLNQFSMVCKAYAVSYDQSTPSLLSPEIAVMITTKASINSHLNRSFQSRGLAITWRNFTCVYTDTWYWQCCIVHPSNLKPPFMDVWLKVTATNHVPGVPRILQCSWKEGLWSVSLIWILLLSTWPPGIHGPPNVLNTSIADMDFGSESWVSLFILHHLICLWFCIAFGCMPSPNLSFSPCNQQYLHSDSRKRRMLAECHFLPQVQWGHQCNCWGLWDFHHHCCCCPGRGKVSQEQDAGRYQDGSGFGGGLWMLAGGPSQGLHMGATGTGFTDSGHCWSG